MSNTTPAPAANSAATSSFNGNQLVEALVDFVRKNPDVLGGADIYNLTVDRPAARAGALAAVLLGIADDAMRPVVRCFLILAAAPHSATDLRAEAWAATTSVFEKLAGRPMTEAEASAVAARYVVASVPDMRAASVLALIEACDAGTAVIVTEAARYRDDGVAPHVPEGALHPALPEDFWVPQLHALAAAATAIADRRDLYVALDTAELTPWRPVHVDRLMSIDGCGVISSQKEDDPLELIGPHVDRWVAALRAGRLGEVLAEIESLPTELDHQKPLLRIQMLDRAGLHIEALEALRALLAAAPKLDSFTRLRLARIAVNADASNLATQLLEGALIDARDQEELESALGIARDTGRDTLEARVGAELARRFPGSPGLRDYRFRKLNAARDYAGLAALAAEQPADAGAEHFYQILADHLDGDMPDYDGALAVAGEDAALTDRLRVACAREALARRRPLEAFAFAMPLPKVAVREAGERLLIDIIEALLIARDAEIADAALRTALIALVERVAAQPTSTHRIGLGALFEPDKAGLAGLPALASIVIELSKRPLATAPARQGGSAGLTWLLQHKPFFGEVMRWLSAQQPFRFGHHVLPAGLLTEPADEAISAVASFLEQMPIDHETDVELVQLWLAIGAAIAPHSSDPDYDLVLMRLAAGKLASSGFPQAGRDLAEVALQNSAASQRRRRLGWFAVADVYHRCRNLHESLLAMACTLAADDETDDAQRWQELATLARLMRDLGLRDEARAALAAGRQVLDRMGLAHLDHRLDIIELQLRLQEVSGNDPRELTVLIEDAMATASRVLEGADASEPVAMLLGQVCRQAAQQGINLPAGADTMLERLHERSGGFARAEVETFGAEAPGADEILRLMRAGGRARYSEDVGYDMLRATIAAARALASDAVLADKQAVSLALEALADHGVGVPGWDEAPVPPPAPARAGEIAEQAMALAGADASILQIGFDSTGRLVRLAATDGELGAAEREDEAVMSERALAAWAVDYPYRYGLDSRPPNAFYTTTEHLRVSALPPGPVIVAADATLQVFPPNLLFVDGEFAGRTRAMASTPSLSWLAAAQARGPVGDGRRRAWISAGDGSGSGTMAGVAARLAPMFDAHGILFDETPQLPADFAGASLAIVTAHGNVHAEGRFFQVVSDEGDLRASVADLARALRNVDVVILFVCSGGRSDRHPGASTTLGLAKKVLDRGCQSVIASPWPLDSRVPSHWLPVFLEHWDAGATVMAANFAANAKVDLRFALDPSAGLALTVFGNPLLRQPARPAAA